MDKAYPTDLTDEPWAVIEPLIPPAQPGGRPRTVDLRRVVNTIFYLAKAGCQWAMLPTDLAKRSTANDYFGVGKADGTWQAIVDALRQQVRVSAGRDPNPSKAAIDSQTVKGSDSGSTGTNFGARIAPAPGFTETTISIPARASTSPVVTGAGALAGSGSPLRRTGRAGARRRTRTPSALRVSWQMTGGRFGFGSRRSHPPAPPTRNSSPPTS